MSSGEAGASARREAERRRRRRMEENAGGHRWLALLTGPSAKQKRQRVEEHNWTTGAAGEQMLAKELARRCASVLVLHDRRMPGSRRANIDHVAVAASGVYVIDTKRYRGKIKVVNPLFGSSRLTIAGRNRNGLLDGLTRQVAAVEQALSDLAPGVPVHGCLCFVDPEGLLAESGLPILRTLKVAGHSLYSPRRLAKRLNRSGPLTSEQALRIYTELAEWLPAA